MSRPNLWLAMYLMGGGLLLAAIFQMYRSPLMMIYLSALPIC